MKDLALVEIFRAAKKRISSGQETYICLAIDYPNGATLSYGSAPRRASNLIRERMGGMSAGVQFWLLKNVPGFKIKDGDTLWNEQMCQYRLRWLDALIKEFS